MIGLDFLPVEYNKNKKREVGRLVGLCKHVGRGEKIFGRYRLRLWLKKRGRYWVVDCEG